MHLNGFIKMPYKSFVLNQAKGDFIQIERWIISFDYNLKKAYLINCI